MPETATSLPIALGEVLGGKYRVDGILGRGGMGIILRARHLELQQDVAIKLMRTHLLERPGLVKRFRREAQAASCLTGEHIVRVHDVGALSSGEPYMVMQLLHGQSLAARLEGGAKIECSEAVEIVLQLCVAMGEAHAKGIIHRDIKPSNLFVSRRSDGHDHLTVVDFGVSKVALDMEHSVLETQTGALIGTLHYMSPEQMRDPKSVDARADIWSMGVVLYHMLSGRLPFEVGTMPVICTSVLHDAPALLPDTIPKPLVDAIGKALAKEPSERFASVSELARELAPFAEGGQRYLAQVSESEALSTDEIATARRSDVASLDSTMQESELVIPKSARLVEGERSRGTWKWGLMAVLALGAWALLRPYFVRTPTSSNRADSVEAISVLDAGTLAEVSRVADSGSDVVRTPDAAPSVATPAASPKRRKSRRVPNKKPKREEKTAPPVEETESRPDPADSRL